jgi:hypothetical protein
MKPAHLNHRAASVLTDQTALSLLILILLGVIAVTIFLSQYNFNPAVRVHSEGLQRPAGGLENPPGHGLLRYLTSVPASLKPLTAAESFTPDNLSDKINGKAELYLSAGFTGLSSQRFAPVSAPDNWLEMYVYNMANQENAFAVFSAQQREDAEAIDACPMGYQTSNAVYCVHGPYYLEIIGSTAEPALLASAITLLTSFMQDNPVEMKSLGTADLFPQAGLVADSIVLISADAFGFADLDRVYIAEYTVGDQTLTAFLSDRNAPDQAAALAKAYASFLIEFGGQPIETDRLPPAGKMIEIFGTHELIFSFGPYLAGVHEAPDTESALDLADRLLERLQQSNDANR